MPINTQSMLGKESTAPKAKVFALIHLKGAEGSSSLGILSCKSSVMLAETLGRERKKNSFG